MSSTSQVTTFADLYTDLMNRTREDTTGAFANRQAKRYINIALQDMHLGQGEKFHWAERRATIQLMPSYSTGTVTTTKGDSFKLVTGASTLWVTANGFGQNNVTTNGLIKFAGDDTVYTIEAVSLDALLTLGDRPQVAATAGSYVAFQDEYALASDFLRPIDQQSFDDNRSIDLVGRTEFRRRYPRNSTVGVPRTATLIELGPSGSTSMRRRIRFSPPPQDAALIPYTYVTNLLAVASDGTGQTALSADTDEPIVPLQYRHAIVYHALAKWYRDKKDDAREQSAAADYTSIMTRIISDNEVGSARAQFRPRITSYTRAAKRPWSGGGGRYDTGGRFDRFEV